MTERPTGVPADPLAQPPDATLRKRQSLRFTASTALLGVVAANAVLLIGPALDDAYITYRYAARFLAGSGLTFNDNEYIEGFTSLAWTLLLSAAASLGSLKPPVASVVLNCLFIVLAAVTLRRLLVTLDIREQWIDAAVVLMATSFAYYRVVYIGLELGLFSVLLLAFYWVLFSAVRRGASQAGIRLLCAGLIAGALAGTRPESTLVLPLVGLVLFAFRQQLGSTRLLAYLAVPWLVTVTAILAWRLSTYGEWLPNSVIAKSVAADSVAGLWRVFRNGLWYLVRAYVDQPALAAMAGIVVVRSCLSRVSRLQTLVLLVPVLIAHAAAMQNGGDWMPYYRFVTVFTPVYLAAFFVTINAWPTAARRSAVACVALVALLHIASNVRYFEPSIAPRIGSFPGWMDLYRRAGETLNAVWVQGDILAAESIGMIGYAAPDIYIHDPLGLTERNLAHDPTARRSVYGRSNWGYTLARDPALILLHHWPHQDGWHRHAPQYPAGYSFYLLPWIANPPRRCLYAVVRADRDERYGFALRRAGARKLAYDEIRFPC